MMEYKNKNNTEHLDKSELLNRHIKFQLSLRKRKLNELLMRYRMKDKEKTFKYRIDMNELKLNVNVVNISLGTDKELIDNLLSLLSSHNDHEVKYALLLCRKYSMIPQAPIQLMIKNNFTLMIVNVLMKYLYDVKVIYESLTILVNLTAEMNDEDKETSLCIMSNGMTLYNRIKNDNNLYDIFIMLISNILLLNKDNQLISKHDIVINIIDDIYSKKLYERVDMIRVINEIDNVDIEIIKKNGCYAGVRFIFDKTDIKLFNNLKTNRPDLLVDYEINDITDEKVTDSASRFGYFIISADTLEEIKACLPSE